MVINKCEQSRTGLKIHFNSSDKIVFDDIVSVVFKEITRYFKVTQVCSVVQNPILEVEANQYGYYNKIYNEDLRDLINLEVSIIYDEKVKSRLHEQSSYC